MDTGHHDIYGWDFTGGPAVVYHRQMMHRFGMTGAINTEKSL